MAVAKYQLCCVLNINIVIKASCFIGFANRIEFMSLSVMKFNNKGHNMNILCAPLYPMNHKSEETLFPWLSTSALANKQFNKEIHYSILIRVLA